MSEDWAAIDMREIEPAIYNDVDNSAGIASGIATPIPEKLRSFPHWIVWRYVMRHGNRTKVPFNPKTERPADPSGIADCGTFDLCDYLVNEGRFDGIGFVFSDHSPFSGVDLDSPFKRENGSMIVEHDPEFEEACAVRKSHWQIIEDFSSYTEWSPSGIGAHIIIEGKTEFARKLGKIEIYSRERFFTITGNTRGLPQLDILERSAALDIFVNKLGPASSYNKPIYDREQTLSDDEVLSRCASPLFERLLAGTDDSGYKSGSEADQALGNIIAQNTDNQEQCVRIFLAAPRCQIRTKLLTRPDLVNRACRKAFDLKSAPIDFDALAGTAARLANRFDGQVANPYAHLMREPPPGLLGELAQFVFDRAPRPVYEFAIVAAIGLMSGVCGRAFNVGSLGLAQYLVLLAPSATGKEAIASGISAIMSAVRAKVPASSEFLGPGKTASAPALSRYLQGNPSFVSIFGEFGLTLQTLTDPRANQNAVELRSLLTDLYGKNGAFQQLGPTIYSESDRNIATVVSPSVSIVGESVAEIFDNACAEHDLSTGFLSRFLVIEYNGKRVSANKAISILPHETLTDKFATLCLEALSLNRQITSGGSPRSIVLNEDAQSIYNNFDAWIDDEINRLSNHALRAMWGRAAVKALKLAGVRAVGVNWQYPLISRSDIEWAIGFVLNDAHRVIRRFDAGEVSTGTVNEDRHKAVVSVIERFFKMDASRLKSYDVDPRLHSAHVIPHRYFLKSLCALAAFRGVGGGSKAVNETLAECEKIDLLRPVPTVDVEKINGSRGKCYIIGPAFQR